LNGRHHQIAIIARWDIPFLLKLEHGVVGEFFAVSHAVGLGPLKFARILLSFEQLVAFAAAESENLRVVSHEGGPVARVHIARAEVALVYTHVALF